VPQVALAILGTLGLPKLASRFSLTRVLLAGARVLGYAPMVAVPFLRDGIAGLAGA
jgi:hypothetical protein